MYGQRINEESRRSKKEADSIWQKMVWFMLPATADLCVLNCLLARL